MNGNSRRFNNINNLWRYTIPILKELTNYGFITADVIIDKFAEKQIKNKNLSTIEVLVDSGYSKYRQYLPNHIT